MEIGNISSVPALLRVLRGNPPVERANGRRAVTSTAALAIAALRKITGLNVGASYEQWNQWGERTSNIMRSSRLAQRAAEQSLAADGAIASFSSNFFPSA
jgi:hypothetical protein